jgi:uncharacterized protein (UPF0248 family)
LVPIHELLNRIRWDADFARADFSIGYYDRVEDRIIVIPLARASFERSGEADAFELTDEEGRTLSIPFHRIKQVFRDGELIWDRAS